MSQQDLGSNVCSTLSSSEDSILLHIRTYLSVFIFNVIVCRGLGLPGGGGAVGARPLASRQLLQLEFFLLKIHKQLSPDVG